MNTLAGEVKVMQQIGRFQVERHLIELGGDTPESPYV